MTNKQKWIFILFIIINFFILLETIYQIDLYLIEEINFDPEGPDYKYENFSLSRVSTQIYNNSKQKKDFINLTIINDNSKIKNEIEKKERVWFKRQNGTYLFNWFLVDSGDKLKLNYKEIIYKNNRSYFLKVNQSYEYFESASKYVYIDYKKNITFNKHNTTIINNSDFINKIDIELVEILENKTVNESDDKKNKSNKEKNISNCIKLDWNTNKIKYSVAGIYLENKCNQNIEEKIKINTKNEFTNNTKLLNISLNKSERKYYRIKNIYRPIIVNINIINKTYDKIYFPQDKEKEREIKIIENWENSIYNIEIITENNKEREINYRSWIKCDNQRVSNYNDFSCSICTFETTIKPYNYFYENSYKNCSILIKNREKDEVIKNKTLKEFEKSKDEKEDLNKNIKIEEKWIQNNYYYVNFDFELNNNNNQELELRAWIKCDDQKLSNYFDFSCTKCEFKGVIFPYYRFYNEDYKSCKFIIEEDDEKIKKNKLENTEKESKMKENHYEIDFNEEWIEQNYKLQINFDLEFNTRKDVRAYIECQNEKLSNYYDFSCTKCEFNTNIEPYIRFYDNNFESCNLIILKEGKEIKRMILTETNLKLSKNKIELKNKTISKSNDEKNENNINNENKKKKNKSNLTNENIYIIERELEMNNSNNIDNNNNNENYITSINNKDKKYKNNSRMLNQVLSNINYFFFFLK